VKYAGQPLSFLGGEANPVKIAACQGVGDVFRLSVEDFFKNGMESDRL